MAGLFVRFGPPDTPTIDDQQLAALRLLATGATVETAARHLDVSPRTVRRRVAAVKQALGVATTTQVLTHAAHHGLV